MLSVSFFFCIKYTVDSRFKIRERKIGVAVASKRGYGGRDSNMDRVLDTGTDTEI